MPEIKREIIRIELAQYEPHPKWIRGKSDPVAVAAMLDSLRPGATRRFHYFRKVDHRRQY